MVAPGTLAITIFFAESVVTGSAAAVEVFALVLAAAGFCCVALVERAGVLGYAPAAS